MASSILTSLASDALLKRVSSGDLKESEPNLKLASSNKGVFKYPRGSKAEPEKTMKKIVDCAKEVVDLRFGVAVTTMEYDSEAKLWSIRTESGDVFQSTQTVVAAGPGTGAILQKVGLKFENVQVYGTMKQTEQIDPYLQGVLLGAKSLTEWGIKDFICDCFGKETVEATSWFGESCSSTEKNVTTHLYMAQHDGRLYMGGPRIVFTSGEITVGNQNPKKYESQFADTESYARTLLDFPKNAKFEKEWGGVMVFPTDDDNALVGRCTDDFDGSLFISSGFASAGFREAYGAGCLLARLMVEGSDWMKDVDDENLIYKSVDPKPRLKKM